MNFFEHQDAARRNTRVMIILYLLAVAAVVIAVDAVIAGVYVWARYEMSPMANPEFFATLRSVPPWLYGAGALGTLVLVLGASLVRMAQLSEGGTQIATMLGARAVASNTRDPLERRLLNVVEEMAIASGVRVPQVYVMDEERGINAFAAGYDISNAIVAVTRGTLETLNREELQGVIGHEFSHIVNGDMSLNIRMMGVLAGILLIGSIGGFIMRSTQDSGRGSRRDSSSGGIFVVGLALFVIGYVGLFCARLIKASVSRQREFLADASSVQFTRNPDGIAGALDQIRASGRKSLIANRYAEEASHMFFGQGISIWLGGLFDTHPPVEERIRRVHPRFLPSGYRQKRSPVSVEGPEPALPGAAAGFAGAGMAGVGGAAAAPAASASTQRVTDIGHVWGRSAGESADLVGTLERGKVEIAQRLLARLSDSFRQGLRDPEGACAAIVALLLAPKEDVLQQQLAAVRAAGETELAALAATLAPEARSLGLALRLPVVDLALPALKSKPERHSSLLKAVEAAIHADRRVSLEEFVLLALLRAQFAPKAGSEPPRFKTIAQAPRDALFLLSLVSWAGSRAGQEADFESAFRAGAKMLGLVDAVPVPLKQVRLDAAETTLQRLRELAPLAKAVLIKALFAAVSADGRIRVIEAELMRMVGAVLDCPLPPLLDTLDPEKLAA